MVWPIWSKADEKGLARYVHEEAALEAAGIRQDVDRLMAEMDPLGRRNVIQSLYENLAERRPPIRYAREKYVHDADWQQVIRTPNEILQVPGEGTCLDLAVLFSGLCLASDLLPFLVVLEGHALVAVSLRHGRKHEGSDAWDAYGRREFEQLEKGVLEAGAVQGLAELIDSERYVAVECTGFAVSQALSSELPEGKGRNHRGLLPFERAVAAGRAQLGVERRRPRYALDVHLLQDELHIGRHDPRQVLEASPRVPSELTETIQLFEKSAPMRLDYRQEVGGVLDFFNRRFVGREAEFAKVAEFVNGETASSYLLVEAPGGFGKSAFLAQLILRAESGDWPGAEPWIVYFLIRDQGDRNSPVAFLQAVNSQLLEHLELKGGTTDSLPKLRGLFSQLWGAAERAVTSETPLVLLVDGLDNQRRSTANSPVAITDLLPSPCSKHVRVIVSSRPNPAPKEQVSREHPLRDAAKIALNTFDPLGVRQVLLRLRRDVAEPLAAVNAEHLDVTVDRVHTLTGGEPLFVRLVADEILAGGETALKRLEEQPPADAEDYFREQLERIQQEADNDDLWLLLGFLVQARIGLTAEELGELSAKPRRKVQKTMAAVSRYLVGERRMELMHKRLEERLAEEFSCDEIAASRARILEWCQSYANRSWPEETPDYVIQEYPLHLAEEGSRRVYYSKVEDDRARDDYYPPLAGHSKAAMYDLLSELLRETHTTTLSYSAARLEHLYPWIDRRDECSRPLMGIYSNMVFDTLEVIKIEAQSELARKRKIRDHLQLESRQTVDEAFLELLEAAHPFGCEHVVPQSWFNKRKQPKTDLHHLFTCEWICKSLRGNRAYYEFTTKAFQEYCGESADSKFEPKSGRGAVARATLYFLLRYPGDIADNTKEMPKDRLPMLIKWAQGDKVDRWERHRNAEIQKVQGNRNPLIDFPELVNKIDFSRGLAS